MEDRWNRKKGAYGGIYFAWAMLESLIGGNMVRIIRCYICHGYHHADVACHYCDARRLANGKYYNHYGIELVRGFHFNIPRLVSYPSPGAVTIACARIVRRANGTSALPASA